MNVYVAMNEKCSSGFGIKKHDLIGGYHSGGIVIQAMTLEEAREIATHQKWEAGNSLEISNRLERVSGVGLVMFADGEC